MKSKRAAWKKTERTRKRAKQKKAMRSHKTRAARLKRQEVIDLAELLKPRPRKLLVLLKVGKKEHLEQIQAGKVRSRHLTYYREGEGAALQPWQDPDEGVAAVLQSDRTRIVLKAPDGTEHVIDTESGLTEQIKFRRDLKVPAFCMHAIHSGEWTERKFGPRELPELMKYLEVSEKMSEYGDHVLVLMPGFVDRVREACRQQGLGLARGYVKYIDETAVHGKIPPELVGFIKLKPFAPEREYRFVFEGVKPLPDPFVLDVGPLHDVTLLMTLEDFKKNVRFKFGEDDAA